MTNLPEKISSAKKIVMMINDPKFKKQLSMALPSHMNADRMARIITTEFRKTPKLVECSPMSLLGSIIQCSQLGLEPGNSLGHAYLIPYSASKKLHTGQWKKEMECQVIIGYRGMIDLARRSGQIISLSSHAIYDNDEFKFKYGINEELSHVPAREDQGRLIGVYAIAHLVGGGHQFDVMWKEKIDKVRMQSKSKDSGPWVTHYDEMAKKTVIRKLFKYLPVSIDIQRAVSLDEAGDRGEQNNRFIFENDEDFDFETFDSEPDKLTEPLIEGEKNGN